MIEHLDEVKDVVNLLQLYKPTIYIYLSHACFLKSLLSAEDRNTIDIREVVVEELKKIFFGLFSFLPSLSDWEWLCVLSNLFK